MGYEFAERFLKGRHAFFVATHTDKKHIHNHIIWNSTALDCKRKFRDFLGSGRAVARLSDAICTEHRLSVIAAPKRGKNHYGKWLGDNAKPTHQELVCGLIDAALLQKPDGFDALLKLLAEAGCEVRRRGDTLSLRHPDRKGFIRLSSIENYTEDALRAVLAGEKEHTPRRKGAQATRKKDALLIDIEAKLQAGKGVGYERWAKVFNVKQMAQTYNYLREHGLLDYEELEARAAAATERYENFTEYSFEGSKSITIEREYHISIVPEGFIQTDYFREDVVMITTYKNQNGDMIRFSQSATTDTNGLSGPSASVSVGNPAEP